jgi:hypothetical protein
LLLWGADEAPLFFGVMWAVVGTALPRIGDRLLIAFREEIPFQSRVVPKRCRVIGRRAKFRLKFSK